VFICGKKRFYGTAGQEICETNPFLIRVQSEEHADVCVVFFFVFLQEGFHWLLALKTLWREPSKGRHPTIREWFDFPFLSLL
jgi:hypothetical protein